MSLQLRGSGNSCVPNGIRPCAVIWRNRDWTYPSILQPIEGDYLIVTVDNLERYFSGTAGYFPGARRFALEGQRVYAQLSSGNHLSLWIHAIGHNYEPLGHRDAVLQMQDLLQPERVWNLAQHVWRDKRPGRAARLIPATPQPSIGSRGRLRLHLIFAFKIRLQYQPTLFVGMLNFDAAYTAFPQELQWTAVYTPTESNAPTMLSVSTLDYFRVVTRANYEITHRDDPVPANEVTTVTTGAYFLINFYLQSWITLVSSLWDVLYTQQAAASSTNLLQTKMLLIPRRQVGQAHIRSWFSNISVVSTFDALPPPGNGTAIVDLRHDLNALDDCTTHHWGTCIFDAFADRFSNVSQVELPTPDLKNLAERIHQQVPPTAPIEILHRHVSLFDEELQPFVVDMHYEQHEHPEVVHIYTDGSFDGTRPDEAHVGWGFAVFVCGKGSFQLEHLAYGCILDDHCPVSMVFRLPSMQELAKLKLSFKPLYGLSPIKATVRLSCIMTLYQLDMVERDNGIFQKRTNTQGCFVH